MVASEWDSPPQVATVSALRKALEEGSELPGNLVLCDTTESVANLQALWAAYQRESPVTAALVGKQDSTVSSAGPQCASLVSVGRQGSPRNEVVRVVCTQLSEHAGPCPKRAITTKIPVSSVISTVTVRLLAPQCYRQFVAGVETQDDPKIIISEWAKLLGWPLADLTGGTWERISDKSGSVVVGHLRVPASLANKIVNFSGTRALFVSSAKPRNPLRSRGSPSLRTNPPRTIFEVRRVAAEANTRRVAQVFRQGGMSNLGLSGVSTSEFDKAVAIGSGSYTWLRKAGHRSTSRLSCSVRAGARYR